MYSHFRNSASRMKVVLVYNPGSGSHTSVKELQEQFTDGSIQVIESIKMGLSLRVSLKGHIEKGEIIAVVGGDGSISAVANLIANTSAILMPLPGGTLNHFTKDLGIPQSIPEAIKYFKTAHRVKIDTGQVGNKLFINNSSIGIYSDSLEDRKEHKQRFGKWPAIITSFFTTLFRFRTYNVELNGKKYSTPLIFVGNNKYEPSGLTFKRSQFNEGLLCVYMVLGNSRLKLFWATINLKLGRRNITKTLKSFDTTSVTISTRKSMRVSRDGEHEKMTSPLTYQVQKNSLTILRRNLKT